MKYNYRPGFRSRGASAADVGAELARLRALGPLTAERVWEAAQPATAPHHVEFEWDGPTAVRDLGLIRARTLIRSIEVIPEVNGVATGPAHRQYVHLPDGEGGPAGTYEPIEVVVAHPDRYARALTALQAKFSAAEIALQELRHAAEAVPDATDAVRLANITLAVQGFATVQAALALLR